MKVAIDFLRKDFRPLEWHEKIGLVQDFFLNQTFTHFPVLEDGLYKGMVALNDVEVLDETKELREFGYVLSSFFCKEKSHWLDLLELFARNDTNVLPVLDENNSYIGYYELNDIVRFLNDTPFLSDPGNLLIIEKEYQSISMSQVVQIVESNNGKLLGLFISETKGETVQITLKLSLGGINEIIQSFRRYGYEIVSHHEDDTYLIGLKERSEYLKKYLDI